MNDDIILKFKKDRQCSCMVTLRRVRATIVAVEKQKGLCVLSVCM